MAKFLNREGIKDALVQIFQTSEKEVIVIVPYIKLSNETFKLLSDADNRGVELTIIYKEDKMIKSERDKLYSLNNLNLLSHPDIHSKCYCNESKMIIASMNLYDYSEKYNREMGVLFDLEEDFFSDDVYDSALEEIRSIVTSAKLEKKNSANGDRDFNLKLLKPISDSLRLSCKIVNKYFENKFFDLTIDNKICCKGYIDYVDVIIEPNLEDNFNEDTGDFVLHRAAIEFKWKEELIQKIHTLFHSNVKFDSFPHFKIYWNTPQNYLTIYRDLKRQPKWAELTNEQVLRKYRQGIDSVINYIKEIERKLR